MESGAILLVLLLFFAPIVLSIYAASRAGQASRTAQQSQNQLLALSFQLHDLEQTLKRERVSPVSNVSDTVEAKATPVAESVTVAPLKEPQEQPMAPQLAREPTPPKPEVPLFAETTGGRNDLERMIGS